MKIAMLGWELPPHNSGGLGVACLELCKALADHGADIDFILPYNAVHDIDFMTIKTTAHPGVLTIEPGHNAYDSYRYHYQDGTSETVNIYEQQRRYEAAITRTIDMASYDVIHAHDWLTFRAALRLKQASDKPLIVHVHSIEHDRAGTHIGNPLVHEIEALAFDMADSIIAVSYHTKRAIVREYGIPESKIQVVHNSIDPTQLPFYDATNEYTYLSEMKSRGYKVVANVGRLTIQKGLSHLLQAAQLAIQKDDKLLFLFVGSGELQQELLRMSAELGISRHVVFAGFQRGKKWRDAYSIADVFVMPSVSEPFGLTPLEAIAHGTPVIISKQSGVAEVISHCLKIDYWDTVALADAIVSVTNNPSLHHELKQNALQQYQSLSWQPSAAKVVDMYRYHRAGVAA